jgi:tripeptidyl-peptidase-1
MPLTTIETLRGQYNIPASATGNSAITQMAAEFNAQPTDVLRSYWAAFNAENGLPVTHFGSVMGATGSTTLGETYLDVEFLAGVGAGNTNWFWNIPPSQADSSASFTQFAQTMLSQAQTAGVGRPGGAPHVISISWGIAEADLTAADIDAANEAFLQLTAVGITIVVSSGDSGANTQQGADAGACYSVLSPSFPASSPYVLSVGATQPVASATGAAFLSLQNPQTPVCQNPGSGYFCLAPQAEMACSSRDYNLITSGGGFSTVAAQPAWQAGAVASYLAHAGTTLPPAGSFAPGNRAYPDVSASGVFYLISCPAAPNECLDASQGPNIVFGTSAAAPVWAGIIGLANAARVAAGQPVLGFVNPLLYNLSATFAANTLLMDITSGDNRCLESAGGPPNCPGCNGYTAIG